MTFYHIENDFEEIGMPECPLLILGVFQLPTIYDVAIHNEPLAIDRSQKIRYFPYFGVRRAKMEV